MTCVASFLRNCAIKVKSDFEGVDQLIAKVKYATVKDKIRQAKFATFSSPHQPLVVRWGNWLNAALSYANNLPEVTAIVKSFEGSGTVVTQAKANLLTIHNLTLKERLAALTVTFKKECKTMTY